MVVYLNGSFIQKEDAYLSPADRGFLFGDGIYEVIRYVEGRPVFAAEHLERMDEGLEGLMIGLDPGIRNRMEEIATELLERNSLMKGQAAVYIQVTRGAVWPRTHTFPEPAAEPTVLMSASPFTPHTGLHQSGVDVITVSDVRWMRCNLKTVNLLPNVLAKQRAKDAGVNSAVMIRDGVVTESPNANIFGVKNGELYTHPASNLILNGITRRAVLNIADEFSIPVRFDPIAEHELFTLDELFFTGTTTDIQPVVKADGKEIGDGKPGAICRKIQQQYNLVLKGEAE